MTLPIFLTGCSFEETKTLVEGSRDLFNEWANVRGTLDAGEPSESLSLKILNWVFELVSNVIWTPVFLFDNDWFRDMLHKFSLISVGLVSTFALFEGFKRILNLKNTTNLTEIAKRFPLAIAVAGFAPLAFVKAIEWLNRATQYVISMATNMIATEQTMSPLNLFDQVGMFLFNILFLALCVPIILHHGRRWFDMLVLGVLTPFAMSAYVFNSLSKWHREWWSNLKSLYLVQFVYAIFFSMLSVIMFAVPFPEDAKGSFAKALILLGGFWRMAFPPSFVTRMTDGGSDNTIDKVKKLNGFVKEKTQRFSNTSSKVNEKVTKATTLLSKKYPFLAPIADKLSKAQSAKEVRKIRQEIEQERQKQIVTQEEKNKRKQVEQEMDRELNELLDDLEQVEKEPNDYNSLCMKRANKKDEE